MKDPWGSSRKAEKRILPLIPKDINGKLVVPLNIFLAKIVKAVNTPKAAAPVGAYPHARRVGNLLFLSGIGPREPETNNIPGLELDAEGNIVKYDIEAQVHSVFRNVNAVLEAAGAKWESLVDITVFLTNMKDDFKRFNEVYATYFKENQPCRTTVEVSALPTPIAVEVKCIAVLE